MRASISPAWRATVGVCLLLAATACGSTSTDPQAGDADRQPSAGEQPIAAPHYFEPCAQIPDSEVRSLIGVSGNSGSPASLSDDAGACTWDNSTTNSILTLRVGTPGSAPGGRVPAQDPLLKPKPIPGADEMVLVAGNRVMFAAKDRLCSVEYFSEETRRTGSHDDAVRLAREVQGGI